MWSGSPAAAAATRNGRVRLIDLGIGGRRIVVRPQESVHEAAGTAAAEGAGQGGGGETGIGECRLVDGMGAALGAPQERGPQLYLRRSGRQHRRHGLGAGDAPGRDKREVADPLHIGREVPRGVILPGAVVVEEAAPVRARFDALQAEDSRPRPVAPASLPPGWSPSRRPGHLSPAAHAHQLPGRDSRR